MSAMTTQVVVYSDESNSRTYTISGHTVVKPRLLIQKRKIGAVGGASGVDNISVVYGAVDSTGAALPGRVAFEVTVRRPVEAVSADVTAALTAFKDVVASDEFANMVNTQNYLK